MPAQAVAAVFETVFAATPALSVGRSRSVAAAFSTSFQATPALTGRAAAVAAAFSTSFTASPSLTGRNNRVAAQFATAFRAVPSLTGASDTHGMSVCDVLGDIISLWGVHCRKNAPSFVIARALADINAAVQTVWNQADERSYWSASTVSITLKHGTDTAVDAWTLETTSVNSVTLSDDIQNVVGPCRIASTKRPLVPLDTIGELESFADFYLDGETATEPLAYHIDRSNQAGEEPVKCVFRCTPDATAEITLHLDVVMQPPRYTTDDLLSCPLFQIPHQYVETLLLPIARYRASSFEMFVAKDQKESIDRDYLMAMNALGLADPLPAKTPEK